MTNKDIAPILSLGSCEICDLCPIIGYATIPMMLYPEELDTNNSSIHAVHRTGVSACCVEYGFSNRLMHKDTFPLVYCISSVGSQI